MLKTYIELPEGRVLSSGEAGEDAIVSVTVTRCVNNGQELTAGSVCAGMLEAKIFGSLSISAGDRLRVYRQEGETRHFLGSFIAEKPTRSGASYLNITAYDPVVLLDRDITGLLQRQELQNCSLQVLAEEVCSFCGVTFTGELPFGHLQVSGLSGEGITGRQVLGWIGQLTGHFCRATPQGDIEFSWYTPNDGVKIGISSQGGSVSYENGILSGLSGSYDGDSALTLSCGGSWDNGALRLVVTGGGQVIGYYSGTLSYEEYGVAPIQKVQLRKTADDVGTVYPDGLEGSLNTYVVEGNPLLGALPEEALPELAAHLYSRLKDISYTPCKVSIPAGYGISAGDVVQITDRNGKTITSYVMKKTQKGQKDTLECTGSPRRDSTTAVNNRSYADLQGRVLKLRTDLQGLMVEHSNTADKAARLELDLEGIRGQVSRQDTLQEQLTAVEQTADSIKLSVERLTNEGAEKIKTGKGFTFDDQGLHIHKEGSEITNRLDESGMQVLRSGETVLQADEKGVMAVDVKVRNYLIVGEHARFEDYGENRTACFWLGGA